MQRLAVAFRYFLYHITSASIIQSSLSWLGSVVNKCNEALGTPLHKCITALKENSQKYNAHVHQGNRRDVKKHRKLNLRNLVDRIGFKKSKIEDNIDRKDMTRTKAMLDDKDIKRSKNSNNPWFCKKDNVAKLACGSMKSYEKFCEAADFTEETILATIKKKLKTFTHRIGTLLRLNLNIQHTYTYIGNSSSNNQIAAGIVTEIRNRADPIITWLSWSSCVTSLFLLLIIFRAKHYQHMFETRSPFDNRFITKEFRELDLKRLREGRETVLPLNRRERAKYVTTTSFRLVASEKVHLNRSALFMTVTTFKLMIHIVADYSLYWVLMTIRNHGKMQAHRKPGTADTGAFISGSGFVARLLQSFIDSFNLQLMVPPSDNACLPNPYPPDFKRYSQIGFLIFLLWFFALLEPYGLRLRHLIMGHYRPERAKTRAMWLYNHILRTRASFMKFARRRLHREYKYSSQSIMTFRQWIRTHIPFRWVKSLLGIIPEVPHCLLCNIAEEPTNPEMIKCAVPSCPGTYCTSCFSDIGQLCTICLSPSDYGDLSDVSWEKGSSHEDETDDDTHGNNASGGNITNLEDGVNTFERNLQDNTSQGSKHGEQKRYLFIRERNDRKNSESAPLLQLNYVIFNVNYYNIKWSHNNIVCGYVRIKEYPIKIEKYTSQIILEKHAIDKEVVVYKDFNNNISHKITPMDGVFQYSMYEIKVNPLEIKKLEHTTRIAKYLRKKKILRQKQNYPKIDLKFFMTCSNNNITNINENITKVDGNRDRDDKEFNNLDRRNNEAINNLPPSGTKENVNNNKTFENNLGKDTTKKKNKNLRKFQTRFANYWKGVKMKMLPHDLMNKNRDSPPIIEKKHKRKKKYNKTKNRHANKASKTTKLKNEHNLENSRLFAYFNERDWVENSFENSKQVNNSIELPKDRQTTNDKETDIFINNIMIPRLNLNFASNSTFGTPITSVRDVTTNPEILSLLSRKELAEGALDRFFKSVVCQSREILESTSSKTENIERSYNGHEIHSIHHNKYVTYRTYKYEGSNKSQERSIQFLLKRVFSGSFSGYKMRKPLSMIKTVYSSLFIRGDDSKDNNLKEDAKCTQTKINKHIKWKDTQIANGNDEKNQTYKGKKEEQRKQRTQSTHQDQKELKDDKPFHIIRDDKEIQTFISLIETANKGIAVYPLMNSCGFQKSDCKVETQDCAIQIEDNIRERRPISQDVGVMTGVRTCTCAAQCYKFNRNIGVITEGLKNKLDPLGHLSCTCELCDSYDGIKPVATKNLTVTGRRPGDSKITKENEISYSNYSSSESISSESEESKTDTTICSLANIDYYKKICYNKKEKYRRSKVKVVTKTNQSTVTDKTKQCDVSTTTSDWWSPIVEKKVNVTKESRIEKKTRDSDMPTKRKRILYRSRGVNAAERNVTFRSSAQLIPERETKYLDVLSPSRYLLESQKYYNELFFNSPRVYPITHVQRIYSNSDKDRSRTSSRHHGRRVRKTKRLDESYSPRRQITPRRRGNEFVRSPESSQRTRRARRRN